MNQHTEPTPPCVATVSTVDNREDLRAELAGSLLTAEETRAAQCQITVEDAWQRRQRRRQQAQLDALEAMRVRAGHRPSAAVAAAIAQKQNRLEHSR